MRFRVSGKVRVRQMDKAGQSVATNPFVLKFVLFFRPNQIVVWMSRDLRGIHIQLLFEDSLAVIWRLFGGYLTVSCTDAL